MGVPCVGRGSVLSPDEALVSSTAAATQIMMGIGPQK